MTQTKSPVIESQDYFPFGLTFNSYQRENSLLNKYQYNGKEKQDALGLDWLDYGARMYDPALGRWMVVDPLADRFSGLSPYNYVYNNPIKMIDPDGRSGEVSIDNKNRTVTVTSNVIFYGSSANASVARSSASDIQNQWNAAGGKVTIGGNEYSINFVVNGSYDSDLSAEEIQGNTDIKNNYINVAEENALGVSFMDGSGNTGQFLTKNIKQDGSTTEAHEMGHGWGAVKGTKDGHPASSDLRGKGQPGIMNPRGTRVDPQYQYDPKAKSGDKGGTVNPEKRKVTQQDINYLNIDKLKFDENGKANLGTLTNKAH